MSKKESDEGPGPGDSRHDEGPDHLGDRHVRHGHMPPPIHHKGK